MNRAETDRSRADDAAQLSRQQEIEMSFVRTLSVRGLVLGAALSPETRRELIRVAIFAQKLNLASFGDDMSFAQAYMVCYNRPLELRRVARDRHERPVGINLPDEDDSYADDLEPRSGDRDRE